MSKTSRKSLPTVLLALCLLIAQAALLGYSSNANVAHAATGAAIFLNPGSSTQGSAQIVAVRGTGFSANAQVIVTFNAPYSTDGSPLGPRSIPPTVNRDGDNRPAPPLNFNSAFPNAIEVLANTDAQGNLVTSNGNNGQIQFGIPSTAVDGIYEVSATDIPLTVTDAAWEGAATQYTINHSPGQRLTVTPVSGSSVQINGDLHITAAPNTFNNGDEVKFFLEDFTASADLGSPSVPSQGSFDPLVPPANPSVPLQLFSCGTVPVQNGATTCSASINGDVTAEVLLQTNGTTPCILSSYYFDQVYAIVAKAVGNTFNLPFSANVVTAGVHLDHGQTALSLSTNQQSLGSTVTVKGTGFAANASVDVFFVTVPNLSATQNCTLVQNLAQAVGAGISTDSFFGSNCLLATVTTDFAGSFTQTVTISNFQGAQASVAGFPGYILAEDFCPLFSPSVTSASSPAFGCHDARLNEAAAAALTVSGATSGTLSLQVASGGTSATAAISSTVTITGTGYIPNEAVDVLETGPNTAASTTGPLAIGAPLQPVAATTCKSEEVATLRANSAGVITGSYLVPETCNTVTSNAGVLNGGAKVTLDATGEQSGLDDVGHLTIPTTTAMIVPINGLAQFNASQAVTLVGDGFAASEPVTFQFGFVDPFTGVISAPLFSVSGISDLTGHVNIGAQTLNPTPVGGSATGGGLYTLTARGLNSSFRAATSVSLPFTGVSLVGFNGNLNCPVSNVLPGQPIAISGSNFAGGTTLLATLNLPTWQSWPVSVNADGTFTFTITTPLGTPAAAYQLVVSGLVNAASSFQEQLRLCTITVGTTVPSITANPTFGTIGITTTVTGQGYGPAEPIAVSLQYNGTSPLSGTDVPGTSQIINTSDANGNFSGVFTVKSTVGALIPGSFNLTATGQQTRLVARTPFIVTGGPLAAQSTIYFAEGYTGTIAGGAAADFTESISILNANNYTTTYTVTYFLENGGATSTTKVVTDSIGPNSVVERAVNTDVGANQKVAAEVSSPAPLSAERIINRSDKSGKALDASSSLGQLINTSATVPDSGVDYFFASGEVQLTNEEYLTVLNPTSNTANVTINILPQSAISSTTVASVPAITVSVPGNSRATVPIRARLVSSGVVKFGLDVNSNVPVASERVEYYGDGIGSGKYGASTKPAGTSAFRQYIFSSDVGQFPSSGGNTAIGTGNDLSEIDVVNPGAASAGSATVTVAFFDKNGKPINSQQVQVDGGTRVTVNVNDVVGTQADVFSVVVTSDKSVFVEKPVFYGGDPANGGTHAVASPSGSPAGLTSVALPYLDLTSASGSVISQTVFLYNPGSAPITVRGTYSSGAQTVVKTYTVQGNSITTVSVNTDAAGLPKGALGGIFQIVNTGSGTGDSFVASVTSSSAAFAWVIGNQGTYPIGAATGP